MRSTTPDVGSYCTNAVRTRAKPINVLRSAITFAASAARLGKSDTTAAPMKLTYTVQGSIMRSEGKRLNLSAAEAACGQKAAEDCRTPRPVGAPLPRNIAKRLGVRQSSAAFGSATASLLSMPFVREWPVSLNEV